MLFNSKISETGLENVIKRAYDELYNVSGTIFITSLY